MWIIFYFTYQRPVGRPFVHLLARTPVNSERLDANILQAFSHFYRLAVNTRIAGTEAGKTIRVGDPVSAG